MGEEEKRGEPFRFLADAEFKALDTQGKALYLVRAQQEVEERQRLLRSQLEELVKKVC
jgi:hypothetical protein